MLSRSARTALGPVIMEKVCKERGVPDSVVHLPWFTVGACFVVIAIHCFSLLLVGWILLCVFFYLLTCVCARVCVEGLWSTTCWCL